MWSPRQFTCLPPVCDLFPPLALTLDRRDQRLVSVSPEIHWQSGINGIATKFQSALPLSHRAPQLRTGSPFSIMWENWGVRHWDKYKLYNGGDHWPYVDPISADRVTTDVNTNMQECSHCRITVCLFQQNE